MNKLKIVKLIVRGKVQKVGYRAAVYGAISDKLPSVYGYIKNLSNGDVELLIYAQPFDLNKVLELAYLGSKYSKVESVEVIEVNGSNHVYETFAIID